MTPYDIVATTAEPAPATKGQLLTEVRRLERAALSRRPARIVATLQDQRFVTERTCAIYADLAANGADVVLFARDLPAYVCEGVRGVALDDDDPLVDVWSVVAVGAEFGMTFAAVDRYEPCDHDLDRPFEAARSLDPEVAQRCLDVLAAHLQ